jgi:hypothetical protein
VTAAKAPAAIIQKITPNGNARGKQPRARVERFAKLAGCLIQFKVPTILLLYSYLWDLISQIFG